VTAPSVTYYAIINVAAAGRGPSGLARRTEDDRGIKDEALRPDLTWGHTSAIVEWKRDAMDFDLMEISGAEAERLIEKFRVAWGSAS
jgi:hypothetical protein